MTKALIAPTLLAVLLWAVPVSAQPTVAVGHGSPPNPPTVEPVAPAAARPFALDRDAKPAPPSFWTRASLHLGDVPVFKNESRAIKLRFTLSGTPPAAQRDLPFASLPAAPALFTIHVEVVGLP
jgi:hypothetical protein